MIITFDPLTSNGLEVGDVLVQYNPEGPTNNLNVKGVIKARVGNFVEVAQLSFESFSAAYPMYVEGTAAPISIIAVERDRDSLPLGMNADIDGFVVSSVGKIQEVQVFDSGIGFLDESTVYMTNLTQADRARMNLESARNNPQSTPQQLLDLEQEYSLKKTAIVAQGKGIALGQGRTEGTWESKTSHLNSKKVIQDSNYYQDFSYEVTTKLNPSTYAAALDDLAHVAGTKVFYKFSLEEGININANINMQLVKYIVSDALITSEQTSSIVTEDNVNIVTPQYQVAIVEE